jgi:hypothetical protein
MARGAVRWGRRKGERGRRKRRGGRRRSVNEGVGVRRASPERLRPLSARCTARPSDLRYIALIQSLCRGVWSPEVIPRYLTKSGQTKTLPLALTTVVHMDLIPCTPIQYSLDCFVKGGGGQPRGTEAAHPAENRATQKRPSALIFSRQLLNLRKTFTIKKQIYLNMCSTAAAKLSKRNGTPRGGRSARRRL